jgi:hypothetical protein
MVALQPILSPLGCQMTSTSVNRKIAPCQKHRLLRYICFCECVLISTNPEAGFSASYASLPAVPAGVDNGCRPCRHVGRETVMDPFALATVDNQPGLAQQRHMAETFG